MLARPALDRDLHRALAEAGYAPLHEYVGRYDMSDATADPIGVPQDVLNAFIDCPGSLEASLLAAVRAQNAALVAENERLKSALRPFADFEIINISCGVLSDDKAFFVKVARPQPTFSMFGAARAALGDQP